MFSSYQGWDLRPEKENDISVNIWRRKGCLLSSFCTTAIWLSPSRCRYNDHSVMVMISFREVWTNILEQTGHFLLCKSSSGHCGYGNWKSENKACGSGQYIFLRYLLCAKLRANRCMLDWVLAIKGHSIKKIGRWKMIFGCWHKYCDNGEGHQAQARVEEARGLEGS